MANKTKAELEKELEEQKAQLEMFKQMMQAMGFNQQKPAQTSSSVSKIKDCVITNLTDGKLILKTLEGRYISLDGEFSARKVTGEMCRSIVEAMPKAYLEGYYMLDERGQQAVEDLFTESELNRLKNDVLTPEQMKNIFSLSLDQIQALYNRALPSQKETIQAQLRHKIEVGTAVDIRIKELMTNLSGIDFINMKPLDEEMLEIIRQHGGKV